MSDIESAPVIQEEQRLWRKIGAGVIAGGILSAGIAPLVAPHESARVQIGPTQFEVSSTFDNFATINLTPLPNIRYQLNSPFHVGAKLKGIDTINESADKQLNTYAVIASQPKGEIEKVQNTVEGLAWETAVTSALISYGAVGGWAAVGRKRRKELLTSAVQHKRAVIVGTTALALAAGVVKAHEPIEPAPIVPVWVPIKSMIPPAFKFNDPDLKRLQVEQGGLTTLGEQNVLKLVSEYERAKQYYETILNNVPGITYKLRQPKANQHIAMLVSDRHDNIEMDPIIRAVGELLGADTLIDAGDDTSVGGAWEEFSIDSLYSNFKDYKYRIVIGGNHDGGGNIMKFYRQKKFEVLSGKPQTIGGVNYLGESDPRKTQLNGLLEDLNGSVTAQGEKLMKIACANGHIAVVVAHSPTAANPAAEAGCVPLSLSGHLHIQVGPTPHRITTVVGGNLRTSKETFTYTNNTSGGAANAFALGERLGKEAGFAAVTFEAGRPVGIQSFKVETSGEIIVESYFSFIPDDQAKSTAAQPLQSVHTHRR